MSLSFLGQIFETTTNYTCRFDGRRIRVDKATDRRQGGGGGGGGG